MTNGINDEAEATAITSKLLKWTAELNIHIILVLHQNKNDQNARGHIGTEAVNKAETVFSVTKEAGQDLSRVEYEFSRDISFDPFAFMIDQNGLPVAIDVPETGQKKTINPRQIDDQKHIEVLNRIYKDRPKLNYKGLQEDIIYEFEFSFGQSKSRDFIKHYEVKEWISKQRNGKEVFYNYKRALF